MNYTMQSIIPTMIYQLEGAADFAFRKSIIEPIRTESTCFEYVLGDGLYEICQADHYVYLLVHGGEGNYISTIGTLVSAQQVSHSGAS